MSAGLPGLGLGGLFFILSALVAPVIELARTVRGRSSVAAWREVGRSFALALAMVVVIDLSVRALLATSLLWGADNGARLNDALVLPLGPIAITLGLLAVMLGVGRLVGAVLAPRAARSSAESVNSRPHHSHAARVRPLRRRPPAGRPPAHPHAERQAP